MKRNVLSYVCAFVIEVLAVGAALVLWNYMTEYRPMAKLLASFVFVVGTALAVLATLRLGEFCRTRHRTILAYTLLALFVFLLPLSMFVPGRITYSCFGLTVYGAIPIPTLDIVVSPSGLLWFRNKTHYVSIDEVSPLLSSHPQIIIVGIGWNGLVRVDDKVTNLEGYEVHILRTPDAFKLFNDFKSHGKRVALIAHSTC